MESTKVPRLRKGKKKQVKDETDRIKQAEKKRRRLEKALATSAAIRSELEKKKQKKKEEQERLDEEGAAIAEAVALHVLLGEDSDNSSNVPVTRDEEFDPWHCNIGLFMDGKRAVVSHPDPKTCSFLSIGRIPSAYGNGSFPSSSLGRNFHFPYSEIEGSMGISAGLIAAEAVSSLQIREDAEIDTVFLDGY
ncbi:hypothetical protein Nepgr_031423 [Nepenthes gracilis]|uniref:Uncharacterized protein n=1 Tax=Nepenthes gracilis TaxID=150966 RepID=A0AAD3Y6T7_NEPGR|nr:hypothetical protein Nepgr_031423 [Nepenthes gracilis]